MSPAGASPTENAGVDSLKQLCEEKREKFLRFVRFRSPTSLAARRDPEDILQSAFMQAQRRWEDFDRSGMALEAWFYRIILNCLFDDRDFQTRQRRDYRDEVVWPDQSSTQFAMGLQNPATSPSEALGRRELQEKIEQVLARLSAEHQQIMVLIHYADLSKEQAAEILGIDGNAARQRYARARVRFREQWKACFGEEELGG
jgi:RNA polymerase sigma-70 factor, ECF subfamily